MALHLAAVGRLVGLALLTLPATPQPGRAQSITIDGSLSPAQTLAGPSYTIGAGLGKQVGGNLFQSFGKFGLVAGESATFTGPTGIANIVGRVTGGSPSSIDGAIRSAIAGANLFLINPFGMIFGPNATVNVGGSFHASTADYLKMADGSLFQATHPGGSTLSAAPPAAFGFLSARPAAITVNGSNLGPVPGTLGLVGGPVTITGGTLTAPGGTIRIASAATSGEIPVDPANGPPATVRSFGAVSIAGGATLDVSNPGGVGNGGSVFIRAGTLTVDASTINADNYGAGAGGEIVLRGDHRIDLADGASIHAAAAARGRGADIVIATRRKGTLSIDDSQVLTAAERRGAAGNLTVVAGNLVIADAGYLASNTDAKGRGGTVRARVAGELAIAGAGAGGFTGITSQTQGAGNAGRVVVSAGNLSIDNSGEISGGTFGGGRGGDVSVSVTGTLAIAGGFIDADANAGSRGDAGNVTVAAGTISITGDGLIASEALGAFHGKRAARGTAGSVTIDAGDLTIGGNGEISSSTRGAGAAGEVVVRVSRQLTIDASAADPHGGPTGIFSQANAGTGNSGSVTVTAADLSISNGAEISVDTFSAGSGGNLSVSVAGTLSIAGGYIIANAEAGSQGNAGNITVAAGSLSLAAGGAISSDAYGPFRRLPAATGAAGTVTVIAGDLTIASNGEISSGTSGPGNAGDIRVEVARQLTIDGSAANPKGGPTGIFTQDNAGSGNAGNVTVSAATLSLIDGGKISGDTFGSGRGGNVSIGVSGTLSIDAGLIVANAEPGSQGNAGNVTVGAGSLSIADGGVIASDALGASRRQPAAAGNAGTVTVIAGDLTIVSNGEISSGTSGPGNAGDVVVEAARQLTIDGSAANPKGGPTGIFTQANSGTGNAGTVIVSAADLSLRGGGEISGDSFSKGKGGDVTVAVAELLTIDGSHSAIAAKAEGAGDAGTVTVAAGQISITGNGEITSSTFAAGNAGSVAVTVAGLLAIDGASANPAFLTGITSQTQGSGNAGAVTVSAGSLSLTADGSIVSSTFKSGNGGGVSVNVAGRLTIDGSGGHPNFLTAISAGTSGGGNAGTVTVSAGELSIASNGEITSSTSGAGKAGSVAVSVAGLLTIDGSAGNPKFLTGLTSQTQGSGDAGSVLVRAADLSISGNGEISSDTFGSGKGGEVAVAVAGLLTIDATAANPKFPTAISAKANAGSTGAGGDVLVTAGSILLTGPGPQITAQSAGTGIAGSLTVAAGTLRILDGAAISTAAASANGGDIHLAVGDLLYLRQGAITTSVNGAFGNGGNILIDPQRLVLDGSRIIAQAVGGNGGNITISTANFVASTDSIVSASSQLGISGTIEIEGPRVDLNGSLVTLPGTLRNPEGILRTSCTGRGARPQSSLTEAGRGGLPQDPEAALPALYLAPRAATPAGDKMPAAIAPLRIGLDLSTNCG